MCLVSWLFSLPDKDHIIYRPFTQLLKSPIFQNMYQEKTRCFQAGSLRFAISSTALFPRRLAVKQEQLTCGQSLFLWKFGVGWPPNVGVGSQPSHGVGRLVTQICMLNKEYYSLRYGDFDSMTSYLTQIKTLKERIRGTKVVLDDDKQTLLCLGMTLPDRCRENIVILHIK